MADGRRDFHAGLNHWTASQMEATSGKWRAKRRLATAMRQVIDRLVGSDAPEEELDLAAEALERYEARLEQHPRSDRYEGFAETGPAGDTAAFFDQSPIIGLSNPLSPPVSLRADREARRVEGEVRFGGAYEGPPGCVHGGWVAAAFDEVLGYANSLSGSPGMTARLTVQYRSPTPLLAPLRFEARLDRIEGRKIFTSGELYAGERLTAEAEGLFVSVGSEKFSGLLEERRRRSGGTGA